MRYPEATPCPNQPPHAAHPEGIPPTSATYEGHCQRSEAANFVHTSNLHLQAIIAIGMVCDQHPKMSSRVGEVGAGRVGSYGATEHSPHVPAPQDAGRPSNHVLFPILRLEA